MATTIQYFDEHDGRILELGDEPIVVGQARDCAVRVKDKLVARRHARFYREKGCHWVVDLGSADGTWINGTRITDPQTLTHRDKIKCGSLVLEYFEK